MDNFLKGSRGRALALGLAAFGLIALLSLLPWGQALENPGLDFCYRLRPTLPPPPDLLIVGIDEASFQEMRRPWPCPSACTGNWSTGWPLTGAGIGPRPRTGFSRRSRRPPTILPPGSS